MPVLKVKKNGVWETVAGTSGHTHIKEEITNFPLSLPANGGNADTLDGKHASDFAEKSYVDDVISTIPSQVNTALEAAKDYTDSEIAEWVGNKTVSKQIAEAVANKANVSAITSHNTSASAHNDIRTSVSKKPGEIVTGKAYTIDETTVTAKEGAEVFNDYKNNKATGQNSHAEGNNTTASSTSAHAEGYYTTASGHSSHAEGHYTTAPGFIGAHAEGYYTTASGSQGIHAEGANTIASGSQGAHAEGYYTTASGYHSHAEGEHTSASGTSAHAEGESTVASGTNSHAEGWGTTAASVDQHVQGRNNKVDSENIYAHIVGNGGNAGHSRVFHSNAHTLDWEGNAWFQGNVYVGSTSGTNRDEGSKKLITEAEILELIGNTKVSEQITAAVSQKSQVQIITWEADD